MLNRRFLAFSTRDAHYKKLSVFLLSLFLLTFLVPTSQQPAFAAQTDFQELFADSNFLSTWQRTDLPVIEQKTSRSWYWGPQPMGGGLYEEYVDSKPNGRRLVQYFDKSRMEINDSTRPEAVTNGLIVVEMITGKLQKGDYTFDEKGSADNIPVAGDPNNTWPTYGGLKRVYNVSMGMQPGSSVLAKLNPEGTVTQNAYVKDDLTRIATVQNNMGIPRAFWEFLNRSGPVYANGAYRTDIISNWLFSTGYPIAEAYWTKVKVAGQEKDVMFQAFERRILTYTPSNPDGFKVEMGNVGQHYVNWRYQGKLPEYSSPVLAIFGGQQPEWYEVTADGLNVRTGPGTTFPNPIATESLPYLQLLAKGNRIQALKSVKGQKLVGDNDVWFQFYENPDLFVYSGYVKKLVLPDMPAPTKTYPGPWVAVSLDKQMLAVYDGQKLIYKTLIASGVTRPNDPDRDYRTPKGSFKIDGSYRPKSQTMEGGASDKANPDYYKLEQVRNVSYFYQDYSIHGTYWHARFGTVPQSHGCVNSTVYDAGLIYQLKAGTVVEIY
jgi:hypothetical protein